MDQKERSMRHTLLVPPPPTYRPGQVATPKHTHPNKVDTDDGKTIASKEFKYSKKGIKLFPNLVSGEEILTHGSQIDRKYVEKPCTVRLLDYRTTASPLKESFHSPQKPTVPGMLAPDPKDTVAGGQASSMNNMIHIKKKLCMMYRDEVADKDRSVHQVDSDQNIDLVQTKEKDKIKLKAKNLFVKDEHSARIPRHGKVSKSKSNPNTSELEGLNDDSSGKLRRSYSTQVKSNIVKEVSNESSAMEKKTYQKKSNHQKKNTNDSSSAEKKPHIMKSPEKCVNAGNLNENNSTQMRRNQKNATGRKTQPKNTEGKDKTCQDLRSSSRQKKEHDMTSKKGIKSTGLGQATKITGDDPDSQTDTVLLQKYPGQGMFDILDEVPLDLSDPADVTPLEQVSGEILENMEVIGDQIKINPLTEEDTLDIYAQDEDYSTECIPSEQLSGDIMEDMQVDGHAIKVLRDDYTVDNAGHLEEEEGEEVSEGVVPEEQESGEEVSGLKVLGTAVYVPQEAAVDSVYEEDLISANSTILSPDSGLEVTGKNLWKVKSNKAMSSQTEVPKIRKYIDTVLQQTEGILDQSKNVSKPIKGAFETLFTCLADVSGAVSSVSRLMIHHKCNVAGNINIQNDLSQFITNSLATMNSLTSMVNVLNNAETDKVNLPDKIVSKEENEDRVEDMSFLSPVQPVHDDKHKVFDRSTSPDVFDEIGHVVTQYSSTPKETIVSLTESDFSNDKMESIGIKSEPVVKYDHNVSTKVMKDSFPTKSQKDKLPTKSHRDTLPAKCHKDKRPTKGHADLLPAKCHKDKHPTKGHGDPLPTKGHRDILPTKGHRDTLSTKGHRDNLPAEGYKGSTPAKGHRDILLDKGQKANLLSKGQRDTFIAKGHLDTSPVNRNIFTDKDVNSMKTSIIPPKNSGEKASMTTQEKNHPVQINSKTEYDESSTNKSIENGGHGKQSRQNLREKNDDLPKPRTLLCSTTEEQSTTPPAPDKRKRAALSPVSRNVSKLARKDSPQPQPKEITPEKKTPTKRVNSHVDCRMRHGEGRHERVNHLDTSMKSPDTSSFQKLSVPAYGKKRPAKNSPEEVIGPVHKRGFLYKEKCLEIVVAVYNHDLSDDFRQEITLQNSIYADYHKVVKFPMYLDLIASRLQQLMYEHLNHWVADMRRCFWNCRLYYKNRKSHLLRCDIVEQFFDEKLIEQFPDNDFSDVSGDPAYVFKLFSLRCSTNPPSETMCEDGQI